MTTTLTDDLEADLEAWSAAIQRARIEYHFHPTGRCPTNHRCPERLAAKAERAAVSRRTRAREKDAS